MSSPFHMISVGFIEKEGRRKKMMKKKRWVRKRRKRRKEKRGERRERGGKKGIRGRRGKGESHQEDLGVEFVAGSNMTVLQRLQTQVRQAVEAVVVCGCQWS